jgi:hypothetical protein
MIAESPLYSLTRHHDQLTTPRPAGSWRKSGAWRLCWCIGSLRRGVHICGMCRGFALPATNSRGNTSTSGRAVFPRRYLAMENFVHRMMYLGTSLFPVYGKFSIEQFILALQLSHLTFQVLHALLEACNLRILGLPCCWSWEMASRVRCRALLLFSAARRTTASVFGFRFTYGLHGSSYADRLEGPTQPVPVPSP